MEPEWGVIIGGGLGALLVEGWLLLKSIELNPDRKCYAVISIIMGLLFIVPFLCVAGLTLGRMAHARTRYKGLAMVGIVLNLLVCLMYAALVVNKLAN